MVKIRNAPRQQQHAGKCMKDMRGEEEDDNEELAKSGKGEEKAKEVAAAVQVVKRKSGAAAAAASSSSKKSKKAISRSQISSSSGSSSSGSSSGGSSSSSSSGGSGKGGDDDDSSSSSSEEEEEEDEEIATSRPVKACHFNTATLGPIQEKLKGGDKEEFLESLLEVCRVAEGNFSRVTASLSVAGTCHQVLHSLLHEKLVGILERSGIGQCGFSRAIIACHLVGAMDMQNGGRRKGLPFSQKDVSSLAPVWLAHRYDPMAPLTVLAPSADILAAMVFGYFRDGSETRDPRQLGKNGKSTLLLNDSFKTTWAVKFLDDSSLFACPVVVCEDDLDFVAAVESATKFLKGIYGRSHGVSACSLVNFKDSIARKEPVVPRKRPASAAPPKRVAPTRYITYVDDIKTAVLGTMSPGKMFPFACPATVRNLIIHKGTLTKCGDGLTGQAATKAARSMREKIKAATARRRLTMDGFLAQCGMNAADGKPIASSFLTQAAVRLKPSARLCSVNSLTLPHALVMVTADLEPAEKQRLLLTAAGFSFDTEGPKPLITKLTLNQLGILKHLSAKPHCVRVTSVTELKGVSDAEVRLLKACNSQKVPFLPIFPPPPANHPLVLLAPYLPQEQLWGTLSSLIYGINMRCKPDMMMKAQCVPAAEREVVLGMAREIAAVTKIPIPQAAKIKATSTAAPSRKRKAPAEDGKKKEKRQQQQQQAAVAPKKAKTTPKKKASEKPKKAAAAEPQREETVKTTTTPPAAIAPLQGAIPVSNIDEELVEEANRAIEILIPGFEKETEQEEEEDMLIQWHVEGESQDEDGV